LPVLPQAAGNKGEPDSAARPVFEVFVEQLFELVAHEKLFFFAAFLFKSEQEPFLGRIIVFDLQVHDDADPGGSVSKDPEQSAIAEASVRGCLDRGKRRLTFAFDNGGPCDFQDQRPSGAE
jgi:hypothetical protein